MVCTWPSSTTEEPFGTSLAVSAITWRMSVATAPRSRPEVVAKICTIDWMSYCETTALEVERLMSAMPPRIGDCELPAAVIGSVCSALSEFDLVLRRLHHDRIGHAVIRIEVVGRRHLRGAGKVDHETVGDVALGQADILRAGAVDIDVEGRIVRRLLDARIGDAGNPADLGQQIVGIGEVGADIGAADLQVDRRRRAEVQDLADDVGRQEGEADAGEQPRQLLAQHAHMLLGRLVAFLQLDLDVAILRADHAGVVVGHVDAGDRHADVVGQRFDLAGGISLRIAFCTSASWLAVSSTRVPTWVRTCIRMLPASTAGKKLRPRNGTSAKDAPTTQRKPITNTGRCASASPRKLW